MDLKIVHIRPVGMDVRANRVSRAVDEIIAVPGLLDVSARRPIHFPPGNPPSGVDRIGHRLYSGIARVAYDCENLMHLPRRRRAHESHPRDVVVHRTWTILLAPHIQQHQVPLTNRYGMIRPWLVVRVSGVGVDRNNRRIISHKIFATKRFHEPLLDFMFLGAERPKR